MNQGQKFCQYAYFISNTLSLASTMQLQQHLSHLRYYTVLLLTFIDLYFSVFAIRCDICHPFENNTMHWWTTQNCGLRRACYKTIIGKNLLLHYWCSGRSATIITFVFGYLLHFHILRAFLQYYYEYILLKQGLTYINVHCNVHGLPKTFCVIYCHFKNEIDFLTKMQFLSKVVFLLTKKKLHKVSLKCYLIWTSYWKFEFSALDEKLSTSF